MKAKNRTRTWSLRSLIAALCLSQSMAFAHGDAALSQASALSALPIAVSVAAPSVVGAAVLSAGAAFTVVSVQVLAEGTVWVLQRASDGARVVLRCAGKAVGGASMAAGVAVTVAAISGGWLLSTAIEVIAFVPNELGKALLHHEQITR